MRPLPELTPANEWFWTSGADGVLRIQGCGECGELVHPPVPICPYCRSRDTKPTAVSGRGTVVGFTVNSHRWLPDFDPPYVVANVALAEDPRVHLTTNVIGCDPADVGIGQEVTVRFEQHEDVLAAAVRADGIPRPGRSGRATRAAGPPRAPRPRALRASRRAERRRAVEDRSSAHGRSAVARGRRLSGRGGGRRADAGGHRRAVDLPRCRRPGDERGWPHRHRGGPADPPDLDQRRRRPARTRGVGHRCGAGGGLGALPPRAVLPHGVGVDLRHPRVPRVRREWRGHRPAGLRPAPRVARALRRDVGGQLDRA